MRRKERVGASQVPCLRLLSLLAVSMQPREERIRRSALAEQPLSLRVIMVLPGPFAAFFCVPTLLPAGRRPVDRAFDLSKIRSRGKKKISLSGARKKKENENDWRPNECSP